MVPDRDEAEQKVRLLFVDDEPSIRITLPLILEKSGFSVTTAATVKDALSEISSKNFDVLLTDLNIGQPGDGFTVVSAMRRTQPNVATVILTGYPAFETALAAIRSQVDDYLVKPAEPEQLVETLRTKLKGRMFEHHITPKRAPLIIQENKEQIINAWVKRVAADTELRAMKISRSGLVDHVPRMLDEIVRLSSAEEREVLPDLIDAAAVHGELRRQQGYTIDLMVRETCMLRKTIELCIQTHLLAVEISLLVPDIISVSETVDYMLEIAIKSFLRKHPDQ